MVITLDRRHARIGWLTRFLLLVPATDLLAHDAIYRSLAGGSEAPRSLAAHAYWPLFVAVVAVLVGSSVWRALGHIQRLEVALRAAPALREAGAKRQRAASDHGAPPSYHREFCSLWPLVAGGTAFLFLVQENLEHLAASGSWLGLAPLDGRLHRDALLLIAAASLVVAALGALVRWRVRALERRLVLATSSFPRPATDRPGQRWSLVAAVCRHRRMLLRLDAGRAPPSLT